MAFVPAGKMKEVDRPESIENAASAAAGLSQPATFDAFKILKDVSPSVVKITTPKDAEGEWSVGTGFMVSSGDNSSCEIATVTHVTGSHDKIQVTINNGQKFDAELVKHDLKRELSVFKIPGLSPDSASCKPMELSAREVKADEVVMGVSSVVDPRWPIPYLGVSLGLVSRDNPVYVRRLSTMIGEDMLRPMGAFLMRGDHGDSGGPIVDAARKVIGIEAAAANGFSLSEMPVFLQNLLQDIAAERKGKQSRN